MTEQNTETAAVESTGDSETEATATVVAPAEGESALGDAGKQALDRMKAERNEANAKAKAATEELAALKAASEGKQAEHEATLAAQSVKDEALGAANLKIAKANLRAAATGKLADPKDALTFIDAAKFDVDDDGNTDEDALVAAIADLLKNKPYLAAQGGKRFEGTADGGTRKADDPKSIDQQISDAEAAGNWSLAGQLKVKKLTEPPTA